MSKITQGEICIAEIRGHRSTESRWRRFWFAEARSHVASDSVSKKQRIVVSFPYATIHSSKQKHIQPCIVKHGIKGLSVQRLD